MPRFHFNVQDGHSADDIEGTDLPDAECARTEAVLLAGALVNEEARRARFEGPWRMNVTDASGRVLYRLDFSLTEPAASDGQS